MRVFEAPEQTRSAVLSKYRVALARNNDNEVDEIEEFDNLVSGDVSISDADIYEDLLSSVEALLAITTSITLPMKDRRARGLESIQEGQIEWLCNQFVPLESFGDYDSEITSDLIWPEDLSRAIETLEWFMKARKDSKVQNQFRLMFPEEISKGASVKNPLNWSCYQIEDVQDALTPGKIATARNERWDPQERGFTPDEADVAYDQDGIMIIRILQPRAATAYASGTRWCTSHPATAQSYLVGGPLYIIFDNGKKYAQAHYNFKESNALNVDDYVSFMDIRDREIYDASSDICRAVADTILQDAREYHANKGLMTVDGYIEQEYSKAVEKRDLEISRANKALETINRTKILGSNLFANRFAGVNYRSDQAKRITDAEDKLADAMVKIGSGADKAVFRSNLSSFSCLSKIQETIDGDEGIGGHSSLNIMMSEDDMNRVLDIITSNYVLWRNDPTFIDSGPNPSREEQMEAILVVADEHELIDDRITQLLIRIPDWCRDNYWDIEPMLGSIKRYYKRLPSPIPPELAIALYKEMGDKAAGNWILRRANAATKRRLGRLDDDADENTDLTWLTNWKANNEQKGVALVELIHAISKADDMGIIVKILRPLAEDMTTAAKAFDRLRNVVRLSDADAIYCIPYTWKSREKKEADQEWIEMALKARKYPPVNTIPDIDWDKDIRIVEPDDDGWFVGEMDFTTRDWRGNLNTELVRGDDWESTQFKAKKHFKMFVDETYYTQSLCEMVGTDGQTSYLDGWGENPVDIERLEEICKNISDGHDGEDADMEDCVDEINNYWVQLFMVNTAFQLRFGQDAWKTLVAGGFPSIEDSLLMRIMEIPINDSMNIGQYAESILPIQKDHVQSKELHPGLLITDDETISGRTFRDFRGRQLSPAPIIKGTYLNYDINLASPDDHMDLTNEVLSIYQSGGNTIDHPAMAIFKGYFVEPHIPMSQRVVRQTNTKGLPKPPAILGYVCFNTRRWIEWAAEDGWTEMWRPGTRHRDRAKDDHVLAVMPIVKNSGSFTTRYYNSTFVPIQAGVIWCTACGGSRPNSKGDNSFVAYFATGGGDSWSRSNNKCYCGGSEKYEPLYDELTE